MLSIITLKGKLLPLIWSLMEMQRQQRVAARKIGARKITSRESAVTTYAGVDGASHNVQGYSCEVRGRTSPKPDPQRQLGCVMLTMWSAPPGRDCICNTYCVVGCPPSCRGGCQVTSSQFCKGDRKHRSGL